LNKIKRSREYFCPKSKWKKLHILVGDNGKIIANSTTDHNKDDRSQVKLAGVSFFLYFRFKSVAKYMYKLLQSDKTHFTF
jgi:hypothetical protein